MTVRSLVLPLLVVSPSLVALLVPVSDTGSSVVGVKVSVQLLRLAPAASEAEVAGQPLRVAPGGRVPVKLQLAVSAAAVALALLVQVSVHVTLLFTVAGSGTQAIEEVRSETSAALTVKLTVALLVFWLALSLAR